MNRKLFRSLMLLLAAFTLSPSRAFCLDETRAMSTLRQKAEQGDAWGQDLLGIFYYYGSQGVKPDYAEAAKWFHLAAQQGHADAQFNIGVMYSNGQGVKQDYFEAVKWYRKAAAQGHADAQFNLGVAYTNGNGVEKSYALAKDWFRTACNNGNQRGCSQARILEQKGH